MHKHKEVHTKKEKHHEVHHDKKKLHDKKTNKHSDTALKAKIARG